MQGEGYNAGLVAISWLIGAVDSYAAFSVVGRLVRNRGVQWWIWLVAGALSMGLGVWSVHFVGLMAVEAAARPGFDPWMTACSALPAIGMSALVLTRLSRPDPTWSRAIAVGALLGAGLVAMLAVGMQALRPAPLWSGAPLLQASAVAIGGGILAVVLGIRVGRCARSGQRLRLRLAASAVLGTAMVATHYVGTRGLHVEPGAGGAHLLGAGLLGGLVAGLALVLLAVTLALATIQQRVQKHARRLDRALDEARRALAHQANHDALTGLPNRAYLMEMLDGLLPARENAPVALMFIDLDGFKTINDTLGHQAGDSCLRAVARSLRCSVRDRDTVVRLGGDEFVIVLERFKGMDNLERICRKILELVSRPVPVDGYSMAVSPSIGVALAPHDGDDAWSLLHKADVAMYEVKGTGKADFRFFQPQMLEQAHARQVLTRDLRDALEDGRLEVHYQPKWDFRTGSVAGVEALARWQHPERGEVPPSVFVPIAERTGLICRLGERVLAEALAQLARWDEEGTPIAYITVNLSLRELRDPGHAERLRALVEATGIGPERVRFEITESSVMRYPDETMQQLRMLSACGFRLLIDDFGTGYSSLSHLRELPVASIKIDQSFVRGSQHNPVDREITEAIVALARKLELETVAEGVETPALAAWLQEIGCDRAQGLYFGAPMRPCELSRYLRNERRADVPG